MMLTALLSALLAAIPVYNPVCPVMVDQPHNIISELEIDSDGTGVLDWVDFELGGIPASAVENVRLMYSGTMTCVFRKTFLGQQTSSQGMLNSFRDTGGGFREWENPSYVMQKAEVRPGRKTVDGKVRVRLNAGSPLVQGKNYFYVSVSIKGSKVSLTDKVTASVTGVSVSGEEQDLVQQGPAERRLGVLVRNCGQEGVHTYRIPGLVTTKSGTLVAVFDKRNNNQCDLNDDIDVGVSRSTDGGLTWSRNVTAIDMDTAGGLPRAQNGTGDPSILIDPATGYLYVIALWAHGLGQSGSSRADGVRYPADWCQPVIACSKDDGKTWEKAVSLYDQVVKPGMYRCLQGPGRGIAMADGTLVFPFQHLDEATSFGGNSIIYSKDHGQTWHLSESFCGNHLTESQVAEIAPGVLMLNARNHDGKNPGRVVFTTSDLGATWTEHPTSHTLPEPVCQGSLLNIPAKGSPLLGGSRMEGNSFGTDILLFSNNDVPKTRTRMTVKASFDRGNTWSKKILLDEGEGWGYSCMSMIDPDTVGILYESSVGQLVFQAVPLKDFFN